VVTHFTASPELTVERVGHGAGTKDFLDRPNLLRLLIGTASQANSDSSLPNAETDRVAVLETNLDDVAPEIVGYCFEQLFAAGALDVFTVPIHMKKQRPGILLSVICEVEKTSELEAIILRETGTFGIRKTTATRSKLQRASATVETRWGTVKVKKGWRSDGLEIITPEYEDCVKIARASGVPLREVYAAIAR
jgi:uncharacterized protein (DUF111 family)